MMRKTDRDASRFILPTVFGAVLLVVGCQERGDFPRRPITLVCPWSPGGGTDRVARQLAAQLEQDLAVPVNVLNAVGGAGVTGHTRGALARPDGYTLTLITPELNMLHWRGLTDITRANFDPLCVVNRDDAALFVRADADWQSLDDLTSKIVAQPRKLRASGTAFGGIWHVCLVGWLDEVGIDPSDVIWVSSNGSAPSLQALIAGGIDMVCCSVPEAETLLAAGKIRCLGVMGDQRIPGLSDVPTFKEQGADWSVRGWRGVALPLDVPDDRRAVLEQAVVRVSESDEFKQFLRRAGFGHASISGAELQSMLADDDNLYGEVFSGEMFRTSRRVWVGPYAFPGLLAVGLVVAVALVSLRDNLLRPVDGRSVSGWETLPLLVVVAWVAAYCLLVEVVGFVLTTAALLAGLLLWLRVSWPAALAVSTVLPPAIYTLFAVALRVPLPRGWLGW